MSVVVSSAPATEPVTLIEAKAHLYVDTSNDDTLITTMISTARIYVENYTRRSLITQTLVARYDRFPSLFQLEKPPLQSVTSIAYLDPAGDSQTVSSGDYDVDIYSTPPRVTEAYGTTWPSTRVDVPNVVTVTYVAGYGAAAAVPETLKHAVLMLIGHWYENREATSQQINVSDIPMSVDSLIRPYVVY